MTGSKGDGCAVWGASVTAALVADGGRDSHGLGPQWLGHNGADRGGEHLVGRGGGTVVAAAVGVTLGEETAFKEARSSPSHGTPRVGVRERVLVLHCRRRR